MNHHIEGSDKNKQRIIQELVPGKQVTLAHLLANPDDMLYQKLGLGTDLEGPGTAIGVLTVTPAETAIIAADIAVKSSGSRIGFLDQTSGSLILSGSVSEVEAALLAVLDYTERELSFTVCRMTRT